METFEVGLSSEYAKSPSTTPGILRAQTQRRSIIEGERYINLSTCCIHMVMHPEEDKRIGI